MRGSQTQLAELKRSLFGPQQHKMGDLLLQTRASSNSQSFGVQQQSRFTTRDTLQPKRPNNSREPPQPRTKSVESLKYLPSQNRLLSKANTSDAKPIRDNGNQLVFHRQTKSSLGMRRELSNFRERAASASLDVLRLDLNAVKFSQMLSIKKESNKDPGCFFSHRSERSGSVEIGKNLISGSASKRNLTEKPNNGSSGKIDSMLKSISKKSSTLLFGNGLLNNSVTRPRASLLDRDNSYHNKQSKKFDSQPTAIDSILDGWRTKPVTQLQKHQPNHALNTWRTDEKKRHLGGLREGISGFRSKETGILLSNREHKEMMAPTTIGIIGDDLAAAYTTGSSVPTGSFRDDLVSPGAHANGNPLQNYFSFKNGKPPQKEDFSKKLMLGNLNLHSLTEAAQHGFSSAQLKFSSSTDRSEPKTMAAGLGLCLSSREPGSGARQTVGESDSQRTSTRPTVELLRQNRQLFDLKKDQLKGHPSFGQHQLAN